MAYIRWFHFKISSLKYFFYNFLEQIDDVVFLLSLFGNDLLFQV